jgi:branched-chain amino acid transport system substrate-binding protein
VAPLSGSLQDTGISCREGAELAVKQLNAAGGLAVQDRRYRVQLLIRDAQDTPEQALSAAQELINRDNVTALIGPPFSSQAIPVAHLAERSGVPMIVQLATNAEVTAGTSCVFRVCFTDGFQGRVMALFARDRLGARRAAILYDLANPFSRDIADIFTATFTGAGGRVVAREGYPTGQPDYLPELARIQAADPEVLFLPGLHPDLRRQLAQIRSLGFTARSWAPTPCTSAIRPICPWWKAPISARISRRRCPARPCGPSTGCTSAPMSGCRLPQAR